MTQSQWRWHRVATTRRALCIHYAHDRGEGGVCFHWIVRTGPVGWVGEKYLWLPSIVPYLYINRALQQYSTTIVILYVLSILLCHRCIWNKSPEGY